MKRISFKDNIFRCVEGTKEIARTDNKSQQWVIVGCSPVYRSFYGDKGSPVCWSSDSKVPDADVDAPFSKSCMNCENDIKGSGQGNSRACRFHRRLAVVMANHMQGQIYQVILSATSVFGKGRSGRWPLDSYAEFLKSNNVALSHVVSEAQFDLDSTFPKLIFTPVRSLTEAEYTIVENQMSKDATKEALKLNVTKAISYGFTPVNPESSSIN
tara:strand:+ start:1369 stop:2007 length:639 start_codon:yes stop_codon:yes gene_type:complete